MKRKILSLSIIIIAQKAYAGFQYVELKNEISFPISHQCNKNDEEITLKENKILIKSDVRNVETHVDLDDPAESVSIIVGDFSETGGCNLAIGYGRSDVNESYSLYVYNNEKRRFLPSIISTITNPDFDDSKITSSYREQARWHKEKICFSKRGRDYYVCEKREYITDYLEKMSICDDRKVCSSPMVVLNGTSKNFTTSIKIDKSKIYKFHDGNQLVETNSYLIKGDKIDLVDYTQTSDGLYFKAIYRGKKTTIGWLFIKDILLNESE